VQTIENDLSQKQNALAISSNDLANKIVEIQSLKNENRDLNNILD